MIINKIKIPFALAPCRQGDNAKVVADNLMTISFLNWKPSRTTQETCRDDWNWQNKKSQWPFI